jgi:hypothetical protein
MRAIGFALAATMILYPVDAMRALRELRDVIETERTSPPLASAGGMKFDLRTSVVHCGLIGWAGRMASLVGSVWVLVASGLWIHYRLRRKALASSSRATFFAVVAGVFIVQATSEVISRVYGIMVL